MNGPTIPRPLIVEELSKLYRNALVTWEPPLAESLERTTAIVPTFNRSAFLCETLESLFAQTLPPAEIIVADDGSTDDTPVRMAALGDRIRYVRKENSGKSDTLNQSLNLAQHPLIWIVDDDDIVSPGALEALTKALSGQPDIGFSYGRYERFQVDPQTGERRVWDCGHWQDVEDDLFFRANLEDLFAHHPGLLVRKAAYEAVGPWSRDYGRSEDYEMLIRLADRFDCRKVDAVVFLQRQHDGQRFGGLAGDRRMERWMFEQGEMFKVVRERLPLTGYLPRPERDATLTPDRRREALIVRGSIMARKKLWAAAFEDFRAACAIESPSPALTDVERGAVRRSLFSKYGAPEVLDDPDIRLGFHRLAGEGAVGAAIARTLSRALIWFIRRSLSTGRLNAAMRYAVLSISVAASAQAGRASLETERLSNLTPL